MYSHSQGGDLPSRTSSPLAHLGVLTAATEVDAPRPTKHLPPTWSRGARGGGGGDRRGHRDAAVSQPLHALPPRPLSKHAETAPPSSLSQSSQPLSPIFSSAILSSLKVTSRTSFIRICRILNKHFFLHLHKYCCFVSVMLR